MPLDIDKLTSHDLIWEGTDHTQSLESAHIPAVMWGNLSRWCYHVARMTYIHNLQVNEVLETSLGQLQARNNPHAEAVAAALNRTGSTERPGSSLMLPTSPLRARAAEAAGASHGAARFPMLFYVKQCSLECVVMETAGVYSGTHQPLFCRHTRFDPFRKEERSSLAAVL